MKKINNIFKLETKEERLNFFDNVWKTKEFKEMALNPQSLVGAIREEYAKHVRYYYHMQNKDIERSAFTSWYSVMSLKNYDNDYVHDLYVLHELTHQATMPYYKGIDFGLWQEKMRQNEVEASLISEVFIYLENPELRAKTFSFPIWADTFLNQETIALYKKDPEAVKKDIMDKRLKVYFNPQTKAEQELAHFRKFSYLFYDTWEFDYHKIEESVLLLLKAGNDLAYDDFLLQNISQNGILFENLVAKHYDNYIKFAFQRPHY